jgi:transposase
MKVLYERCCGLDVHKKTVVACRVTPDGKEVRTFGTMTDELLALTDWLQAATCTHVAMESTGVYWKPIYNLLEATEMTVLVVNAKHMKAVPGRKTDVKDAEWIAQLLQHGLLTGSFIPDRPQRELRELVRYRRSLVEERTREANRIQKVLEGANIKLTSAISDVLGVAGRAMLAALIGGETDPAVVAGAATTNLKASPEELERAVHGVMGDHQRQMLGIQLRHVDFLNREIAQLDQEVEQRLAKETDALERLDTIPGVGRRGAEEILAAIGTDMSRFPTADALASWAKVCPGNNQSGGKRRSGSTGKVKTPLRTTLVEAAHAASRKRNTYLGTMFWRLAARKGKQRAAMAVAHRILVIAYHILKDGTSYEDLGPDYQTKRNRDAVIHRALAQLKSVGCSATITEAA